MISYKDFKKVGDIKYTSKLYNLHNELADLQNLYVNKTKYLSSINYKFTPELVVYLESLQNANGYFKVLDGLEFTKLCTKSFLTDFEIAQLKAYIIIKSKTLPKLQSSVKVILTYLTLEDADYKAILDIYNHDIATQLLKGRSVNFGMGLSTMEVRCDRRSNMIIDWFKTNRMKKYLLSMGKTLYNACTSPLGERYVCYRIDERYLYIHWKKQISTFPNKQLYRFKPTSFIHTPNCLMEEANAKFNTNELILKTNDLGILQKITLLKDRVSVLNTIYNEL